MQQAEPFLLVANVQLADQTTSILGSAFWGALYATLACWVIATVVVYVLISKVRCFFENQGDRSWSA